MMLTKIAVLAATFAFAASGVASPPPIVAAPDQSDAPLREIGHVRATDPLCKSLVSHATAAVNVFLDDNLRIAQTVQLLRTIDLDSSPLAKSLGSRDMTRRYVTLRASAVQGVGEMKAFLDEAKTEPNESQRAELIAFANALEGAIYRQKKIAEDLSRFIAYVDSHDGLTSDEQEEARVALQAAQNDSRTFVDPFGWENDIPPQLSQRAKYGAEQLEQRSKPIASDAARAAAHVEGAFSGC
ncbi:MAG TPA: hypothetical protein VKG44_00980 [Candidatus Baltobacteraceae bacterium]|nr:hypothetical protein [Candidatus Baltobacteraceae bacterium]